MLLSFLQILFLELISCFAGILPNLVSSSPSATAMLVSFQHSEATPLGTNLPPIGEDGEIVPDHVSVSSDEDDDPALGFLTATHVPTTGGSSLVTYCHFFHPSPSSSACHL